MAMYTENVNIRRNWETCTRGAPETRWSTMYASMNAEGDIIINRVAHKMLGSPDSYQLLFDRERDTIGLRPARLERDANAFPAKPRGRHGGIRIRGHKIMREFGIRIGSTMIFDCCQMDNHGILILDLRSSRPLRRKSSRKTVDHYDDHDY